MMLRPRAFELCTWNVLNRQPSGPMLSSRSEPPAVWALPPLRGTSSQVTKTWRNFKDGRKTSNGQMTTERAGQTGTRKDPA